MQPTIYEISASGRVGVQLPELDVPEATLPKDLLRDELDLPEVSELQVIRHFTNLSQKNYAIDKGFYPLGSCTMKYNPRLNEDVARLPGFAHLHPLTDEEGSQGALALMYQLQNWLAEISGFKKVSLMPAAGAQGEFAGILMIRKYHENRCVSKRTRILVPKRADGTSPATVTMDGYQADEVPLGGNGDVDLEALKAACDDSVPGMMLAVPHPLALFERQILDVIKAVHDCGGL